MENILKINELVKSLNFLCDTEFIYIIIYKKAEM